MSSSAPLPGSFLGRLAQSEIPRRVLGAMISIWVPGAGHVMLGHSRIGWIVAAISLVIGAATVGCAMAALTTGFLLFGAIYILCTVASVISLFALPPGPRLKEGLIALWPVFVLFVGFRGAAYVVQNYALDTVRMPSLAMAPAIGAGDYVFVSKHADAVRVGDVVSFEGKDKQLLIRRVVAVGGQRVRYDLNSDKLFVDGQPVVDTKDGEFIARDLDADGKPGPDRTLGRLIETNGSVRYAIAPPPYVHSDEVFLPEHVLRADELFVLSDYRAHEPDSRAFGPISRASIRGKALFVFMSGPSLAGPGRIWKPLSAAK